MRVGQLDRRGRSVLGAVVTVLIVASCGGSAASGTPKPAQPTGTGTATPLPAITPTPTPMAGGIYVDPTADLGPISPFVYGTNFGPWLAVSPDQQPFVEQAGIKFITWPGGNWGDENDITQKQVDDFVAMCRKLGAEPRIVVRLRGSTPEQAAEWVNYANKTHDYKVKYWGIGNETDLYSKNGASQGYTLATYVKDWRAFAEAMRKVDPTIKLIGPDVSQYVANPTDSYMKDRVDWLRGFLKADGDLVDVVSIHRYPYGENEPTVEQLRSSTSEWDQMIPSLRQLIRDETGRDIPVAVTELNSSWQAMTGGDATLDSHYNAIWFGDVLGRLIRQDAFIVAQFALTGQYAIVGPYDPWPIWNVYVMYGQFGAERLNATSDDPLVSAFAAKRPDGTVTVMLVNLGSAAATKSIEITGFGGGSVETWQFDKEHKAAKVMPTALNGSVTLPPESMTLLVIPKS